MSNGDKTSETSSEETAAVETTSPYRKPGNYGVLLGNIAILVAIGWVGWSTGAEGRFTRPEAGLLILALMVGFAVLSGRGITGYWRGILIDQRNKMSLSRLQLVAWTLLILSTVLTAVLTNVALGSDSPLAIDIPSELWVLLGITTASAVGSPAVLSTKRKKGANQTELKRTKEELEKDAAVDVDVERSTMVLYNRHPADARWGDLLKGDEVGNAATVDLGKLQMFFFTFVLVLGYGAAIATLLEGTTVINTLPPIDDSMNTLLGISHTGYLANKTVSHSQEPEKPKEGTAE